MAISPAGPARRPTRRYLARPASGRRHDLDQAAARVSGPELIRVSAKDQYEGWLENPDGTWFSCRAGWVTAPPVPQVLCKSVKTGTSMAVVQRSSTRRTVTVQY